MFAYKYRSVDQIEYTLDILLKEQLYCSDWSNFNDPMEAMFRFNGKTTAEHLKEIRGKKSQTRICSLSETDNNILLWSHYASGFSGLAIQVVLPDSVHKVNYGSDFPIVDSNDSAYRDTVKILTTKHSVWEYEQEVRILQNEKYFKLETPVKRVIAGHRMNPAMLECLQIVCRNKGILLEKTEIAYNGIEIKPLE